MHTVLIIENSHNNLLFPLPPLPVQLEPNFLPIATPQCKQPGSSQHIIPFQSHPKRIYGARPTFTTSSCSGQSPLKKPTSLFLVPRLSCIEGPDYNASRDPILELSIGNQEIKQEIHE